MGRSPGIVLGAEAPGKSRYASGIMDDFRGRAMMMGLVYVFGGLFLIDIVLLRPRSPGTMKLRGLAFPFRRRICMSQTCTAGFIREAI